MNGRKLDGGRQPRFSSAAVNGSANRSANNNAIIACFSFFFCRTQRGNIKRNAFATQDRPGREKTQSGNVESKQT